MRSSFRYEDDDLTYGKEFIKADMSSFEQELLIEEYPSAICTGPDGWVYFTKYSDDLAWYFMDADGNVREIG